mmetsp:Transcript_27381/g.66485  ORF Transcript_27381/g.66485 Transcript_27381/m.66485 type:complete len:149 (-) Transcript_27381:532-978(-)
MVDRGIFDEEQGIPSYRPDSRLPTREGAKVLRIGYAPGGWDVICHSSKETEEHIGNRRFNLCIEIHVEAYKKAKLRVNKSAVISDIVGSIRASSATGGGFVRFDMETRRWYEVGDKIARDKVGQSLRMCSSSKKKTKEEVPSPRTRAV